MGILVICILKLHNCNDRNSSHLQFWDHRTAMLIIFVICSFGNITAMIGIFRICSFGATGMQWWEFLSSAVLGSHNCNYGNSCYLQLWRCRTAMMGIFVIWSFGITELQQWEFMSSISGPQNCNEGNSYNLHFGVHRSAIMGIFVISSFSIL